MKVKDSIEVQKRYEKCKQNIEALITFKNDFRENYDGNNDLLQNLDYETMYIIEDFTTQIERQISRLKKQLKEMAF